MNTKAHRSCIIVNALRETCLVSNPQIGDDVVFLEKYNKTRIKSDRRKSGTEQKSNRQKNLDDSGKLKGCRDVRALRRADEHVVQLKSISLPRSAHGDPAQWMR
jgi:hypothetical protein